MVIEAQMKMALESRRTMSVLKGRLAGAYSQKNPIKAGDDHPINV
jgi:hypothetical protein